jgi:two-component system, NarL family, nitrate/nitrite response regulator NarL
MSAVGEPARARPALRVALVAGDPIRHLGLMAIIRGGGHDVVEHHGGADVVLVDGESIDQYGAPAVTLGRADCGQAGALPADATAVQIDAALLAAAAGLIVRVPSLPSPSFEALDDSEAPLLTPRETDVLAAIADGLSNKATARRLGISQHTVKFHAESLFRKLGAVSRTDAVRKGLRQRLFEI